MAHVLNQLVQGYGLAEHVCDVKDPNLGAILSDCEHQEEESRVHCKIGKMLSFNILCIH